MNDHVRTWWPVVAFVVAPIGLALWWAVGAYVKMLSRAEAVAVVGEAFKSHADVVDEIRQVIESKLESLHQGQKELTKATQAIDRRLVRVETSLNGAVVKWDKKTERRTPQGG